MDLEGIAQGIVTFVNEGGVWFMAGLFIGAGGVSGLFIRQYFAGRWHGTHACNLRVSHLVATIVDRDNAFEAERAEKLEWKATAEFEQRRRGDAVAAVERVVSETGDGS